MYEYTFLNRVCITDISLGLRLQFTYSVTYSDIDEKNCSITCVQLIPTKIFSVKILNSSSVELIKINFIRLNYRNRYRCTKTFTHQIRNNVGPVWGDITTTKNRLNNYENYFVCRRKIIDFGDVSVVVRPSGEGGSLKVVWTCHITINIK